MKYLIDQAAIDDRFNAQMMKVQTALDKITDVIDDMYKPGSMSRATPGQKMQLKHAADDFKRLHDKVQNKA
jgi:Mg2+ and Co2+ transporter CorA